MAVYPYGRQIGSLGVWVIKSVKSPISIEICDSKQTKVVRTNKLKHCYIPDVKDCTT